MGGSREKKEIFVESVFICLFYLRLFYMDLTVVRSRTMWFSGLVLVANSIILTKMVEDKTMMAFWVVCSLGHVVDNCLFQIISIGRWIRTMAVQQHKF